MRPCHVSVGHAGCIAKTTCPRRLNLEKRSNSFFQGAYFALSKRMPRPASSPVTISAFASIQSLSSLPLISQAAILTCELRPMRFALPESASL